jgi:dihydrofolate reductase
MRPLRYAVNVTLDGCCHHEEGLPPDRESMAFWTREVGRADALLYGRVTYGMMESAWRRPPDGVWPAWMHDWEVPFAESIDRARKYVVSQTLADAGLIDEYVFVVHPVLAGHGPTLLSGLRRSLTLELVGREDLGSGAVVQRYRPTPGPDVTPRAGESPRAR